MKTSHNLCISIDKDITPHIATLCDYWGLNNFDDDNKYYAIYGVYAGLYKIKGVTEELLYKCYMQNKLDNLIHIKYRYSKSKYYEDFIRLNIKIGNTRLIHPDNEEDIKIMNEDIKLVDDSHCPSCHAPDFIDKTNTTEPKIINFADIENIEGRYNCISGVGCECSICFKVVCKLCSEYYGRIGDTICNDCLDTKSLQKNISKKISKYKAYDRDNFDVDNDIDLSYILSIFRVQKFVCYVCNDLVMSTNYKPYCCYQFSVDRIDNSLPHNKGNILISCYYCNCRHHYKFDQKNKVCKYGCHTTERVLRKREDVSKEYISKLINSIKM
jgi:hypothetical protein